MDQRLRKELLKAQQREITEHFIYDQLSKAAKDERNRDILTEISKDELKHYSFWKKYTKTNIQPNRAKLLWYSMITKVFGMTFGIRLMEKGEKDAQINYDLFSKDIREIKGVIADEEKHEDKLIALLEEDRLSYIGSIVLGLNDALVELTGALAGFTLALQNSRLIAIIGLITGFAASLSMAASEYLSTKAESASTRRDSCAEEEHLKERSLGNKEAKLSVNFRSNIITHSTNYSTTHSNNQSNNRSNKSSKKDRLNQLDHFGHKHHHAKHPLRASIYTGIAYLLTVLTLVFPFFLLSNVFFALSWTIFNALIIIFCFTFYVSIAQNLPFKRKFFEMAFISLGVAAVTFIIGYFIKMFLGVDI